MRGGGWVIHHRKAQQCWHHLLKQLKQFDVGLRHHQRKACSIATRPRESGDMTRAKRIRMAHKDNWNGRGRLFRSRGIDRAWRDDGVDPKPDKLFRECAHAFRISFGVSILDDDSFTFDVTQFTKRCAECKHGIWKCARAVPHETDPARFCLLSLRREWPGGCAADKRDELAPLHCRPPGGAVWTAWYLSNLSA